LRYGREVPTMLSSIHGAAQHQYRGRLLWRAP
jgi:hypothetical protein